MSAKKNIVPTKREVLLELRRAADDWRTCNQEPDGTIRDASVRHTIRCLETAALIVSAYKPKTKRARRTS